MHYKIWNEKDQRWYEKAAHTSQEIVHWVETHLDLSLNWTVEPMVNVNELTHAQITSALAAKGFSSKRVWHIDDVQTAIDEANKNWGFDIVMTDERKLTLLDEVLEDSDNTDIPIALEDAVYDYGMEINAQIHGPAVEGDYAERRIREGNNPND